MKEFVKEIQGIASLSLQAFPSTNTKDILAKLVKETKLKAVLMGVRRTDPHSAEVGQFKSAPRLRDVIPGLAPVHEGASYSRLEI